MIIKISSLILNNVLSGTIESNENEWINDLLDFRNSVTDEGIYPTGPSFFTVTNYNEATQNSEYTFYVPLNKKVNLKSDSMYNFYKEFNLKDTISAKLIDLDEDIKEVYDVLRICASENNLKIIEPFYNVYLENYGVEIIQVYCEIK